MSKWGGRRAQAWTAAVLARSGRVCVLQLPGCTRVATEADHILSRRARPDLQYDVTNGRPACRHCNATRGDGTRDARPVVDARNLFEAAFDPGRISAQSPPRTPGKTGDLVRFESDGARS